MESIHNQYGGGGGVEQNVDLYVYFSINDHF
jgi:hypothetical protein